MLTPTHALLCSSLVRQQTAVQKAASAIAEMCLMRESAYHSVSVGVFIMVYISRYIYKLNTDGKCYAHSQGNRLVSGIKAYVKFLSSS